MRVEWHGQSAFTLTGQEAKVFIDPFGDMGPLLADRRLKFDYPPIEVDDVDLLILPVGGGPTIGAAQAGAIVSRLDARWVVPMHYRTARADFLPDTEEEFVAQMPQTARFEGASVDTADLPTEGGPIAVVPAAP